MRPVNSFPALLLEKRSERALVIADLHIGWEVSLSQRGIHIPSQTTKLIEKMTDVIHKSNPNSIIILGDIKHTVEKLAHEEWKDVPLFFEKISDMISDIHVVPGNHDGNLDALVTPNIKIHDSSGILWGSTGLIHGHAWPSPEVASAQNLILAHLHAGVAFTDSLGFRMIKQVWVKAGYNQTRIKKALPRISKTSRGKKQAKNKPSGNEDVSSGQCVILLSFNELLGGRSVNAPIENKKRTYIGPILRSSAVDFENAELYLLDGTFLGSIKQLKNI